MLFQQITDSIHYHYDFNGNRTTTVLPDGRQINYLYYGSGHLHQINLDGEVISDIERDKLHREIQRTQGALTSRYELDPVGRLKKQIAALNGLSESGKAAVGAGYIPAHTAVKRSYGYDKTGNLLHSTDQRTGTTHFEYDKLGQPLKVKNQTFAFDPAYNLINEYGEQVKDNRIAAYNGIKFFYDDFGNTIHKEHSDGSTQNLYYDLFDRLVKVETFMKNAETGEWDKEVWVFEYDALDRRVSKGRLKNGAMETVENVSDGLRDNACLKTQTGKGILDSEITFLWDGSRLLQEHNSDGLYTYIYTDQDSYEPLAQIHNYTNTESESRQEVNYFHCDQIGIPREMTDKDGKLLWFGEYDAWGKLTEETNVTGRAHQPFRLQNQYCDREIRLHYNFFRYYDPDVGRFVNQDPIGLLGGDNLYLFAPNGQVWIDPLGLVKTPRVTYASNGAVKSASVVIRRKDLGKGKSTSKENRDYVKSLGRCDDDAGHILGKLLGGSRNNRNMFPQLPKINRGQYRDFERDIYNLVKANGKTKLSWSFNTPPGFTRPTSVVYRVYQQGQLVLQRTFRNI
ncbi:RHS repeat-associated core domain-containing protein [Neisseria wadsworthii]|uniref:RHS repeat-associated core domain-containing protein n=1 Tax=Neisseria wadsworthii TaxID=607711 RepID=UPI001FD33D9E|nr:RHS repeat-associated core domain-containing protein [Neisseria wadsworthii]